MIIKANAFSKQGCAPLWCSHFEKYRSVQYSTWSQPSLFSFAQGNGHNLHFKASIKLVADKTPFWRGTTAQQIGSSTQWSGEEKTLLGWCIVTHQFFLVGWGGEKEWRGTGRGKEIQLTSVYYLSLFNVHSRAPPEIFQIILYLSGLTNVSIDLVWVAVGSIWYRTALIVLFSLYTNWPDTNKSRIESFFLAPGCSRTHKLKTFYAHVKRLSNYLLHSSYRQTCGRVIQASRSSINMFLSAVTLRSTAARQAFYPLKKYPNVHVYTHTCVYLVIYTRVPISTYTHTFINSLSDSKFVRKFSQKIPIKKKKKKLNLKALCILYIYKYIHAGFFFSLFKKAL